MGMDSDSGSNFSGGTRGGYLQIARRDPGPAEVIILEQIIVL